MKTTLSAMTSGPGGGRDERRPATLEDAVDAARREIARISRTLLADDGLLPSEDLEAAIRSALRAHGGPARQIRDAAAPRT